MPLTLLTLMRHDYPAYRSNLNGGADLRAWPGTTISAIRSTCDECSWVWNPTIGGSETPMVIKHINTFCRIHGRAYAGNSSS
jgi:hypothetical protein